MSYWEFDVNPRALDVIGNFEISEEKQFRGPATLSTVLLVGFQHFRSAPSAPGRETNLPPHDPSVRYFAFIHLYAP